MSLNVRKFYNASGGIHRLWMVDVRLGLSGAMSQHQPPDSLPRPPQDGVPKPEEDLGPKEEDTGAPTRPTGGNSPGHGREMTAHKSAPAIPGPGRTGGAGNVRWAQNGMN